MRKIDRERCITQTISSVEIDPVICFSKGCYTLIEINSSKLRHLVPYPLMCEWAGGPSSL